MPVKKNYNQIMHQYEGEERSGILSASAAIAKGRKDPVFFGEHFLGLRFHPAQKVWLWLTTRTMIEEAHELAGLVGVPVPPLEMLIDHPFLKNILCPSNRFGKTFVTAVKHIWYNFYKIGVTGPPEYIADIRYSTLNISPHSLQVDAAYRYIVDIFDDKLIYLWDGKKVRNICKIKNFLAGHKSVKREVHFINNSMIKGVPTGEDQASSLAGTQFFYISYDEAPQSLHLREELPAKIQSRLIDSGGPLDLIGTPEVDKPSHAYYQRIVKDGLKVNNGFFTLTGKLADNIFIGEEEKKKTLEAIRQTDPEKYRQVAFGEFVSTGSKLFNPAIVNMLWNDEQSLDTGIPGHDYLISIDWGFADEGDPTVIDVIDYTELRDKKSSDQEGQVYYKLVFHERIKGGDPYTVLARIRLLQQDFNNAKIIHDSSSMGGVILKKMLREMHVHGMIDFAFNGDKAEMLFMTVLAMTYGRHAHKDSNGKVTELAPSFGKLRSIIIPELEEQLGNYKLEDKKLEQDEVMTLGMAMWYLEKKYAGHKTKVWDLNILANKPEQVLRTSGKTIETKTFESKSFNISERRIA